MGLLGGFKGKLFAKAKKENKNRGTPVVCVRYNTFSEFDPEPSVVPSCSSANPGRNQIVKERRRPTKPEVRDVFVPNGIGNEEVTPSRIARPESPPAITVFRTPPDTPNASTVFRTPPESRPASAPANKITVNGDYLPPPKEPPERKLSAENDSDGDDDNDGKFKIHFVQNIQHAEDERSSVEEEYEEATRNSIDYSSQASQIFFGEEQELVVGRPRHFTFDNDEDNTDTASKSSSASA